MIFLYFRIHLQREISLLEKSKLISVDPEVPDGLKSHFPPKISSTIRAWASVNWEQYVTLDVTKHLVDSGAVDQNDFLFRFGFIKLLIPYYHMPKYIYIYCFPNSL